ncbi:hypothetical protein D3C73_1618610 [compost metagenome]
MFKLIIIFVYTFWFFVGVRICIIQIILVCQSWILSKDIDVLDVILHCDDLIRLIR